MAALHAVDGTSVCFGDRLLLSSALFFGYVYGRVRGDGRHPTLVVDAHPQVAAHLREKEGGKASQDAHLATLVLQPLRQFERAVVEIVKATDHAASTLSSTVAYGQTVRLKHSFSGLFITLSASDAGEPIEFRSITSDLSTPQTPKARRDMPTSSVDLHEDLSASSLAQAQLFRMLPKYSKIRKEGDGVRLGDQVIFQHLDSGRVLASGDVDSMVTDIDQVLLAAGKAEDKVIGIVASRLEKKEVTFSRSKRGEAEIWTLHGFDKKCPASLPHPGAAADGGRANGSRDSERGPGEAPAVIKAGNIISLHHVESDCFLAVQPRTIARPDWLPDLGVPLPAWDKKKEKKEAKRTSECFVERGSDMHNEFSTYSALWAIERDEPQKGGVVTLYRPNKSSNSGLLYRLRHLETNKYLNTTETNGGFILGTVSGTFQNPKLDSTSLVRFLPDSTPSKSDEATTSVVGGHTLVRIQFVVSKLLLHVRKNCDATLSNRVIYEDLFVIRKLPTRMAYDLAKAAASSSLLLACAANPPQQLIRSGGPRSPTPPLDALAVAGACLTVLEGIRDDTNAVDDKDQENEVENPILCRQRLLLDTQVHVFCFLFLIWSSLVEARDDVPAGQSDRASSPSVFDDVSFHSSQSSSESFGTTRLSPLDERIIDLKTICYCVLMQLCRRPDSKDQHPARRNESAMALQPWVVLLTQLAGGETIHTGRTRHGNHAEDGLRLIMAILKDQPAAVKGLSKQVVKQCITYLVPALSNEGNHTDTPKLYKDSNRLAVLTSLCVCSGAGVESHQELIRGTIQLASKSVLHYSRSRADRIQILVPRPAGQQRVQTMPCLGDTLNASSTDDVPAQLKREGACWTDLSFFMQAWPSSAVAYFAATRELLHSLAFNNTAGSAFIRKTVDIAEVLDGISLAPPSWQAPWAAAKEYPAHPYLDPLRAAYVKLARAAYIGHTAKKYVDGSCLRPLHPAGGAAPARVRASMASRLLTLTHTEKERKTQWNTLPPRHGRRGAIVPIHVPHTPLGAMGGLRLDTAVPASRGGSGDRKTIEHLLRRDGFLRRVAGVLEPQVVEKLAARALVNPQLLSSGSPVPLSDGDGRVVVFLISGDLLRVSQSTGSRISAPAVINEDCYIPVPPDAPREPTSPVSLKSGSLASPLHPRDRISSFPVAHSAPRQLSKYSDLSSPTTLASPARSAPQYVAASTARVYTLSPSDILTILQHCNEAHRLSLRTAVRHLKVGNQQCTGKPDVFTGLVDYIKGDTVLSEGAISDRVYYVVHGELNLSGTTVTSPRSVCAGEVMNPVAQSASTPWTASVVSDSVRLLEARVVDITATAASARDGGAACEDQSDASVAQLSLGPHDSGSHRYYDVVDEVAESASFSGTDGASEPSTDEASSADEGCKADPLDDERWPWHRHILVTGLKTALERFLSSNSVLVTTNVARNVLLAEWLSLLSNLIDLDLYTEEELDILLPLLANILDPDTDVVDEATPSFSPGRVERYRFPHPLSDDVDLDLKRRTTKPLSTSYRGATGASPAPTSLPHKHESELSPPRSRHMVMSPSLNFSAATQRGASACLAKLRSGSLMSPRITRAASISAEATTVSPPAIACVKSATGLSTATAPDITAMASTLNGHTGSAQRPSNELLVVTRAKLQVCRIFLKLLAAPGGSPASPTTGETGSDSSDEVDVASPMSCLTQGHRSGSDVSSALAGSPRGLISHLSASWQLQTAADDCVRGDVRNAAFLLNLQNILLRVMRYKASRDLFVTAFRLYLLISSHREKMAAGGGPSPSSASSKTLEEHLRDELADDALNEEDSLLLRLVEHCKAFSHRGDSTVDLSQDEENETIIAALSYLRSVIQVPASLTQPAYSSLEQRQNKLNSLGAMRIVINTVDSTSRTEVQEEVVKGGLELAIALLQGGNHEVQSWLRDYFFARRDETLFVVLRDRITKAMSSIDRSLSEAQKREESGEWSSVADLPIDCPASPSFAGPLFHVAETMRFLQLCTEGHNTALQNYFRVQEDNVQSHDLVRESLKFLSSLNSLQRQVRGQEVQMSDFCLRAAVQTWNTLTEFCQGPVPDNQTTLIEGDIGLEVNRVFLTKGSGPLISEVQNAAVITMLSVVEGCTTLFAPLSLRRSLNLDLLLDRICSISEDEREDTEFGYNVYLLLSFLCDYDSYSQWEDVEVAAMLDPSRNPARASVLSFYRARTAQVEIMRGGSSLERVYFRKPTACLGLTRRARKKLLDNVNRGVDQARLVDFFDRVEETVFELELIYAASDTGRASADLAQSGTTLHDRVHKWSPIVRWIGHGVVLVCNVALLFASTKHAETRPSIWGLGFLAHPDWGFIDVGDCMLPVAVYGLVFTLVLALAGIIWVGLLDYAWFEGPVLLFSRDRERRRKQGRYSVAAYISTDHPFRDEGWTFDRRKLPFTTVVVQSLDELSFLQQVTGLVACGLSLVVSPFFVSLLLLSLLTESAVIRHVFNAVTRNGKSLLLAMLLGMILMYLFAVVGFVLFRDNFNGEGDANCSSMLRCFVFTVTDGLRAGGGIGEVMAAPQWGSDLHGFRLLYDMAFFLFVTVIFMNIVFGIIVDTFGELRQKREAREHELRTRCFICNVSSSEFDKRADGFANHVARDHNMWNYLFFVFYLAKKPRDELTGQESFVVDCLTKNDFKFVPLNTSLALKQESAFAELQASAGQPSESEQANREDVEALGGRLEALEMKVTSQYTVLEEYLSQLSKDLRTRKSRPGDLWDKARNWNRAGCGAPRPDRPRAKTVSERPKKMPNPEPPQIATEPVSKKPAPAPTPSSMPLHEGAADGLRFQKKQPAPPNKPLPTSPVLSAEGSSTTVVQSKPTPLHQMPGSPEHLGYKVVGFPRFNTEDLLGGVLHTESPMWHAGGGGSVDGSESELEKTAATTASKSSTTLTIPRADSYPEQQQQQQAKAGCLKSSLKIGGSPAAGNQRKTTKVTLPLLVARGPPNSAENSPRVQGQGTSPTLETPVQDGDRSFPGGTFALESSFNPAWLNNSFGTYANFYGAHNASFGTFSEPPDECGSASSTPSAYAETSLITGDKSGASAGVVITLTAVIKVAAYASQLNLLRRSQPSSHAKIPDLVVQSPSVPTSIDADSRAGTPIDPLGGTTSSLHTIGSPVRPCDATPHKYKDKYPHHHPVHVATQDPDPPAEQPPKPAHPVDASPRGNTSTGNKTAVQKRRTLRSNDDGVDPTSSPGFETRLRDRLHSRVNSTKQKLNELQEIRTTEDSSFEQLRGRLKKLRETRDTKETPTAPAAENMPEGTGTSTGRPAADAAGPLWQQAQASIGELSANNNNTNNNNTKNGNTNSSSNKTPTASPAEGTHPIEHGAAREDTNASAEDDGDLLAVQSLLERETGYRLQKTVSQVGNGKKHRRDLMNGTSAGAPRAFQGLRRAGTSSSLYAHQLRPSPVLRRRKPSQLTDVGELAAHHGQHASSTSVLDNYRTLHSSTPSSSVSPRGPPQFFTLGRSTSEQPTPRHLTELALPSPKASMNTPSGSVKSRRRSDDGDYLQPLRLSPTSDSGAVFSRKSGSSSWATTVEAVPWESELPSLQSINSFVRLQAGVQSPNYFPTSRHHWGDSDDESTSGDVVSLHSPRVDGHTPAHKLPHNRRASEVTVRRAPSSSSMHAAPPKGRPGSPATLSSASSATSKSEMQLQVDSILKLSTLK